MTVSQTGIDEIRRRLLDMQARAKDLTPVWPHVGDVVRQAEVEQYATEGTRLLGHPWAPLSPHYLAWKGSHGYSTRIEVLTGATKAALTGNPMQVEIYTPTSAEFGVNGKIAFWQQYGTKKMPARPLIILTPDIVEKSNQLIARYVTKGRLGL